MVRLMPIQVLQNVGSKTQQSPVIAHQVFRWVDIDSIKTHDSESLPHATRKLFRVEPRARDSASFPRIA